MSLLLNDIHLPLLVKTTLSEHSQYKSLPWNNLDQLSVLWGVFTKCKKNIRDGFRLENLSWRLWYRQSVLHKKAEPRTSEDISYSTANSTEKKELTRSRSLPNLSQWSQQKQLLSTKPITNIKRKFYIRATADRSNNTSLERPLTFTKKLSNTSNSTLSKPVSLLSDMIQLKNEPSGGALVRNSGLRRCQANYCRLDQFFLNTTTATS